LLRGRPRELTRGPDGKRRFLVDRTTRPDDRLAVTLPRYVWEHIVASAKAGQRKRQGQKGKPNTHWDNLYKDAITAFALKRKDELVASGMKATGANGAADQAASEACELAMKRYQLLRSPDTIKDWMQRFRR
jgi:hypothetical protein